jgi:hypothetical protein
MNVKRRHLLQNSIYALAGFGLARLGIGPVNAREVPTLLAKNELRPGRFGLIPSQLSQRFFEGVLSGDRVFKDRYDRFVAQGFKFTTDSIVGVNLADAGNEPFLFATLSGKRTDESTAVTEFAVISTIYTNKTLFDLGASSSTFNTKNSQLQALTFYLPGTNKSSGIQIDRQFILAGTSADLSERLSALLAKNYGRTNPNATLDLVYPDLKTAGVGGLQFVTAIDLVQQQVARENFLTPTQDKYVLEKLDLAIRSLGLNSTRQVTVAGSADGYATFTTLPLAIKLASAANLIANAKRLDSDPAIMPRQSEIPEPSYR